MSEDWSFFWPSPEHELLSLCVTKIYNHDKILQIHKRSKQETLISRQKFKKFFLHLYVGNLLRVQKLPTSNQILDSKKQIICNNFVILLKSPQNSLKTKTKANCDKFQVFCSHLPLLSKTKLHQFGPKFLHQLNEGRFRLNFDGFCVISSQTQNIAVQWQKQQQKFQKKNDN